MSATCRVCLAKDPNRATKVSTCRARRRCLDCGAALCNNHSKAVSTMTNYTENMGRRVCSNCRAKLPEAAFVAIEGAD